MENRPLYDERILEAIEACRPGSDDVADPALAHLAAAMAANPALENLYQRLQQLDGRLAASFRDVPVPEGLAQRLIERLAAARTEQVAATGPEEAAESPAGEPGQVVAARPKRVSRRWLLAVGGPVAVAAGLFVAAWIVAGRPPDYTEQLVLKETMEFFKDELPRPGYLLSDVDHRPPGAHPISRDVRQLPGMRWRSISRLLDRRGVAYDMPGGRDRLYVVRRTVPGLPIQPSPRPATGGFSISAWQDGELLYVLVVQGNPRACQKYLVPPGPLT